MSDKKIEEGEQVEEGKPDRASPAFGWNNKINNLPVQQQEVRARKKIMPPVHKIYKIMFWNSEE